MITIGRYNDWLEEAAIHYSAAVKSGSCGAVGSNVTWSLNSSGVLTISGSGSVADYDAADNKAPWAEQCTSIKSVVIDRGITSIGAYAFDGCTNLIDIYYGGSETQWKKVEIDTVGNEPLTNAVVSYAIAYSGSCGDSGDNVTWELDDVGLLSISGTGKMKDYSYEKPAPWNSQASIIKKVIINNDITFIGGFAFRNCYKLTGVTIPNSVKTLGTGVFWECNDLTSVTIPKGVTAIGHGTFSHCRSLKQVQVDEANTVYSSVDGVLFSKEKKTLIYCPIGFLGSYSIPNNVIEIGAEAFSRCRGLTGITISGSVKTIGADAFSDCDGLTSVTIPSGVTTIGGYAFSSCEKLAKVILPDSVVTVAIGVFLYCGSLKEIHVDVKNSVYASENGVLFTKDKKTLVRVPGGFSGSYSVPSGVTVVGYYSFGGCYDLTRVVLPHGVSCIEGSAFANCSRLTSITIPDSVTAINGAAFSACDNLTDVYYGGSVEQWKAISMGDWNEDLTTVTIHYNRNIPASGVKVTGKALSWNSTDDAVYKLYPSTVEDSVIRSEWQSGTYTNALDYAATKDTPTASEKQYAQTFAFSDVEPGSYKLAIFKPGKYAPKIMAITVGDSDCDVGDAKLWLYGDVTGDGAVNVVDATQIQRYRAGKASKFNEGTAQDMADRKVAANVTELSSGDDQINVVDATQIQRYRAGKASAFNSMR